MNKEAVREWIVALRSGVYLQGQKCLQSDSHKFCCLGVACDLYGKKNNLEWYPGSNTYSFMGSNKFLPTTVCNWLEIAPDIQDDLISMNDNGVPFSKIADYLETLI
jgi:hypothetical protein